MRKLFLLFFIIISCSGCRTFTNTQLETHEWKYYKIGYLTGVSCRAKLSTPSCEIFLEKMEEME